MSYEAFREADKKAAEILLSKGISDPRLRRELIKPSDYEAIRKYDSQIASEIVKIMAKPSASVPSLPDNSKPRHDWASSAYDR